MFAVRPLSPIEERWTNMLRLNRPQWHLHQKQLHGRWAKSICTHRQRAYHSNTAATTFISHHQLHLHPSQLNSSYSALTSCCSFTSPSTHSYHTSSPVHQSTYAMASLPADQTLHALHHAKSAQDVQRSISALLGIRIPTTIVTDGDGKTTFAESNTFRPQQQQQSPPSDGYHMSSGPLLLTGAIYELMFAQMTVYHLPLLADAVYEHMLRMDMQPSHSIKVQLLRLLADSKPTMSEICIRRCHQMVDAMVARRTHQYHSTAAMEAREYIHITLDSCIRSGSIEEAKILFRYFDPELQPNPTLLIRPDASSYSRILNLLCQALPMPRLDEAEEYFQQLRSARDEQGLPLSIPAEVWTYMIVAKAFNGKVKGAIQMIREQQTQTPSNISSSTPINGDALHSPSNIVGIQSYLSTIIACMEQSDRHLNDAVTLFVELHQIHDSTHSPSDPKRLPFAYQLPPHPSKLSSSSSLVTVTDSSSTALTPDVNDYRHLIPLLRFHFTPLALHQFRTGLRHLRQAFLNGSPLSVDLRRKVQPLWDEFSSNGRAYLYHYFLDYMISNQYEIPYVATNLYIRACRYAQPSSIWEQAAAVFQWLAQLGRYERFESSFTCLIDSYAYAYPKPLLHQAMGLKHHMDVNGLPFTPNIITAFLNVMTRAAASEEAELEETDQLNTPMLFRGHDRLEGLHELPPSTGPMSKRAYILPPPEFQTPSFVKEAFDSAQLFFKQAHPSLLSPRMYCQLMHVAVQANQFQTALEIFQREYNQDVNRMQMLKEQQELEFEQFNSSGTVPVPAEWHNGRLQGSPLARPLEDLYFRATMDISSLNALIFAASSLNNPFHMLELWSLVQSQKWPSETQPPHFVVPIFKSPVPVTPGQPGEHELAGPTPTPKQVPPPPQWAKTDIQPNYTTHWHLTSWIDALFKLKNFLRSIKKSSPTTQSKPNSATTAIAGTPTSITLPTFTFSSDSLNNVSLDRVDQLINAFQSVERAAYKSLSTSDSTSDSRHQTQSIWQPFTELVVSRDQWRRQNQTTTPLTATTRPTSHTGSTNSKRTTNTAPRPTGTGTGTGSSAAGDVVKHDRSNDRANIVIKRAPPKTFQTNSKDAPSPFHLNLHFLPHEHVRSNLEAVLHFSLRRLQTEYLIRGTIEATGWTMVHGHGQNQMLDEGRRDLYPLGSNAPYVPASRTEWRNSRYRPSYDGLLTTTPADATPTPPTIPLNPVGRIIHRFLEVHLGIKPEFLAVDGNPGMTRVKFGDLSKWISGKVKKTA